MRLSLRTAQLNSLEVTHTNVHEHAAVVERLRPKSEAILKVLASFLSGLRIFASFFPFSARRQISIARLVGSVSIVSNLNLSILALMILCIAASISPATEEVETAGSRDRRK